MPATPCAVIVDPLGYTVSVTITRNTADGAVAASYTTENGSTARTSPLVVSSHTTFWLAGPGVYYVSLKVAGVETYGKTVGVSRGQRATVAPNPGRTVPAVTSDDDGIYIAPKDGAIVRIGDGATPEPLEWGLLEVVATSDLADSTHTNSGVWALIHGDPAGETFDGLLEGADIAAVSELGNTADWTATTGGLRGVGAAAIHRGSGDLQRAEAVTGSIWHEGSGDSTVAEAYTFTAQMPLNNGAITAYHAFHVSGVEDAENTGTITDAVGLWIEELTAGSGSNIGLVIAGGGTFQLFAGGTTPSQFNGLLIAAAGLKSHARDILNAPSTAPTDGDILANQVSWYLDEASNTLKVRVRYAGGTYKTGSVALA